ALECSAEEKVSLVDIIKSRLLLAALVQIGWTSTMIDECHDWYRPRKRHCQEKSSAKKGQGVCRVAQPHTQPQPMAELCG
ncbi:MAG: hypothetical protein ACRD2L_08560, partial [Terriglobia bacterium]